MLIRGYVARDVEETIRVYEDAMGLSEPEGEDGEQVALDREAWNARLRENFSVVAVVAGQIVAFGEIDRSGKLNGLFVMEEYQNRTIGSQIVEILMGYFPSLVVMVEAPAGTMGFFEKLGFVAIKELREEEAGVVASTYLMSSPVPDATRQESVAGQNYWIRADV